MVAFKDWERFQQVLHVFGKYELRHLVDSFRKKPAELQPTQLRKSFEELGGAFLKVGQLLSLRPDLVPQAYCDEFSKLQDAVPPFPGETAKKIVEQELRKPLKTVFSTFELKPLAAASIGQVHLAKLRNGKKVAVKVQRPDVRSTIEANLDILAYLAQTLQKRYPQDIVDLPQIVEEFKHYTENELDYEKEAKNIEAIRKNQVQDRGIVIPQVHWEHTTEKILVLEYIEGKAFTQLLQANYRFSKTTMRNITLSIFSQIFEHGVFHADPHPGNLFLLKGSKIGLLDFGIVGHLTKEMQEQITELFIALIQRDVDLLAETLARIGFVHRNCDMNQLKEDLRDTLGKYYNARLENVHFSELIVHAIQAAKRNHIQLPHNFVLLGKCAITLEGLGRRIDPHFNLVETSQPFVQRLLQKRLQPKYIAQKAFKNLRNLHRFAQDLPRLSNQLTETLSHSDSDIHRVKEDLDLIANEIGFFGNKMLMALCGGIFLLGGVLLLHYDQYLWNGLPLFSLAGFVLAGLCFVRLILSNARMTA